MLCRHHRLLHRKRGLPAKLLPDGTLEVTFGDGHRGQSSSRHRLPHGFW